MSYDNPYGLLILGYLGVSWIRENRVLLIIGLRLSFGLAQQLLILCVFQSLTIFHFGFFEFIFDFLNYCIKIFVVMTEYFDAPF